MAYLRESLTFEAAKLELLEEEGAPGGAKDLFLKGICIEGGVENHNKRTYPIREIAKAVNQINETLKKGQSVLGEVDHPEDLKINLEIGRAHV